MVVIGPTLFLVFPPRKKYSSGNQPYRMHKRCYHRLPLFPNTPSHSNTLFRLKVATVHYFRTCQYLLPAKHTTFAHRIFFGHEVFFFLSQAPATLDITTNLNRVGLADCKTLSSGRSIGSKLGPLGVLMANTSVKARNG